MFEWGDLKVEINLFSKNMEDYLKIWRKVFSSLIKNECKNIIITIKIFSIIFPIFCFMDIHDSQDNRGRERLSL